MTRISPGTPLPVPPLRDQNTDLLPDGTVDPAHFTDCGEACVSSVIEALTSYHVPVGCIRSILRLPQDNGITGPADLNQALAVFRLQSWTLREAAGNWLKSARLRNHGHYALLLGRWIDPAQLHWVIAYEHGVQGVWVMDPWTASHRYIDAVEIDRLGAGVGVTVNGWA